MKSIANSIGVFGVLPIKIKKKKKEWDNCLLMGWSSNQRGERDSYEGVAARSETSWAVEESCVASWDLNFWIAESTAFLYESAAIPLGNIFPLLHYNKLSPSSSSPSP